MAAVPYNLYEDMRSSVRFPLELPVQVRSGDKLIAAHTKNISAGGVLFSMETEMSIGSVISFDIAMPAYINGTDKDIQMNCVGRVVRCSPQEEYCAVAAVIDEYRFER